MDKPTDSNKTLTDEQFDILKNAILERKYSWACLLLLKFVGEKPSDYIPSRTYYHIVQENYSNKE